MVLILQSSVLVWDPSVYNASLEEWYNKPDWPFFEQFFSKRLMKPEDQLYLLHPGWHSIILLLLTMHPLILKR